MKTVVIPTLNEAANIGLLIQEIFQKLGASETRVVIVDDGSTDGTCDTVRALKQRYDSVTLLERENRRGLGSAVRYGTEHVTDGPVAVMDADFSHSPHYLPIMFDEVTKGFDLVIGSRYISGGNTIGWPGTRIAISKFATLLARKLFALSVRDPMSGFFVVRSAEIINDSIQDADFKLLLELVVKNRVMKIREVPIIFRERTKGKSKLGGRTMLFYIWLLLKLILNTGRGQKR